MKFASYNVQYGFGLDGRYDLERIVAGLTGDHFPVWVEID